MKLKRLAASAAAVVIGVLGLSVVSASPAAAVVTERGVWRASSTDPSKIGTAEWGCGAATPINTGVVAWACAIRSRNGLHVQVAAVVQNTRSSLYTANAAMLRGDIYGHDFGRWECASSGIAANSWATCYGDTDDYAAKIWVLDAGVNGTFLKTEGATV